MSFVHSFVHYRFFWCTPLCMCFLCTPFLDAYYCTVQGLLDWFEVDLGFTELLFIEIDLCVMCVFCALLWGCVFCALRTKDFSCMGWLRLVGSLKLQVSFANEPFKRDYILQTKPIIFKEPTNRSHPIVVRAAISSLFFRARAAQKGVLCVFYAECTTKNTFADSLAQEDVFLDLFCCGSLLFLVCFSKTVSFVDLVWCMGWLRLVGSLEL